MDQVQAIDPYYNTVPESRGIARTKGTYNGPTGRDDADAAKLAAFLAQKAQDNG